MTDDGDLTDLIWEAFERHRQQVRDTPGRRVQVDLARIRSKIANMDPAEVERRVAEVEQMLRESENPGGC